MVTEDAQTTPRSLGYRMPAEWDRHQATWIAWPHNRGDWPGKFEAIPWVYAEIVRRLSRVEEVNIVIRSARERAQARGVLKRNQVDLSKVKFHLWPTNRVWTRDSGPLFVRREDQQDRIAVTNWRFNAWAKYPDWKLDNQLPERVAKKLRMKQFPAMILREGKPYQVVLEGGSIDVNGRGLMLTTEECLLSRVQQRNPGLSRQDLERVFAGYLDVGKVIWLGSGIAGDDTHGHVDDIARFVAANTVVTVLEPSRADTNFEPLQNNLNRLRAATDLQGCKLRIVSLPLPRPLIFQAPRLPATYPTFY